MQYRIFISMSTLQRHSAANYSPIGDLSFIKNAEQIIAKLIRLVKGCVPSTDMVK